jgi:RNA polymerase sigma-70 factor (ECF subfamily)
MDPTERDNAEWVERLRAGDEQAWSELFDRFAERLWRAICRVGGFRPGEEDQVEDIRQETLVAALRSIRQFRGDAKLETWLHRLAACKTVDHIRKRRRTAVAMPPPPAPDNGQPISNEPPDEDTPDAILMRKERLAALEECLQKLGQHHEQWETIVRLHCFGEMLYKEIAQTLDLPLGTVQAALHRARLLLADCLDRNKTGLEYDQRGVT